MLLLTLSSHHSRRHDLVSNIKRSSGRCRDTAAKTTHLQQKSFIVADS